MNNVINFEPSHSIKNISGTQHRFHSLPHTAELFGIKLDKLPFSLRPILEGIARNVGQNGVTAEQVQALGNWAEHRGTKPVEIPFTAGCVIMHDLRDTPDIVDFAAMRSATRLQPYPKTSVAHNHKATLQQPYALLHQPQPPDKQPQSDPITHDGGGTEKPNK